MFKNSTQKPPAKKSICSGGDGSVKPVRYTLSNTLPHGENWLWLADSDDFIQSIRNIKTGAFFHTLFLNYWFYSNFQK